jgi:hypothetical protein
MMNGGIMTKAGEKSLTVFFNPPLTDTRQVDSRIKAVMLDIKIYRAYMWLYSCSCEMVRKMDRVLLDKKHQALLEQAWARGYRTPDTAAMRTSITIFRESLENLDPNNAEMVRHRVVRLPACTARDLFNMAVESDKIIDDVFRSIRQSDYMKIFRDMKASGMEYQGSTSLQEVANIWSALWAISVIQENYPSSKGEKLQPNWIGCLI